MSVSNGQLANAATFNGAFVSKSSDSTISATLTQDKESVLKEIATPSTPASGYGKIYFKTDGKLYQLNDAGIETQVGTGTGGAGGVNFISNGNAEDNNTTGWATYADAAGSSPVDGTGGTANVTNTVTAVTPLAGTYSFLLAKDAVNRQGQGWSYDFTVAPAYRAKVLQISFDYLVNSGTFTAGTSSADSDVTVWIYDVTNSQLIQPSSYKLLSNSASIVDKFNATFQSSATGSSYRIIFHVATTSASAYTLEVDNVSVSPSTYVYGTPVTDWQSYTPSGSWTSNTTYTGRWRRVGDSAQVYVRAALSGAPTAASLTINLPSGLVIDTNKLTTSTVGNQNLGTARSVTATSTNYTGAVIYNNTTSVAVISSGAGNIWSNTIPAAWANGDYAQLDFIVPIAGWSSSVQTSDQTDTRVVAARARRATSNQTVSTTAATKVLLNSVSIDTHGAFDITTNNRFIVPVSGFYSVTGCVYCSAVTSGTALDVAVYKNGSAAGVSGFFSSNASAEVFATANGIISCNAGDFLELYVTCSDGNYNVLNSEGTYLTMQRISGPSAIAASESVNAAYWVSANFAASTTVPINFDAKEFDSHSAVTTSVTAWRFTAPISGTYFINAYWYLTASAASLAVYKNGTLNKFISFSNFGAVIGTGSTLIKLNAGDYIDLRPDAARTITGGSLNAVNVSQIQISRVGN